MKHLRLLCCWLIISFATQSFAQDMTELTATEVANYARRTSRQYAGIHDPSIVQTGNLYYIMGTHQGFARSSDLMNWTGLGMRYARVNSDGTVSSCDFADAYSVNQTRKVRALVNGEVKEVDFGTYDAKAWARSGVSTYNIGGNLWAPDIIYNPTMKKWCMYMSVNGDGWHSVIVLLTSNTITGEFVYQGPVTFSGFINGSDTIISWKKTDLELVIGEQSSLPSRYNKGGAWGSYWPNNIDPCVFYDADGTLWMSYGSWSGGIFMIRLDPTTGLRDYTVTYPVTTVRDDHALSDPYFGIRIAGGDYVSGEGSYIEKIGNYYYLFMSNGGLESNRGYVMRVFRSKNPAGPYVDVRGNTAIYDWYALNYGPGNTDTRGDLLMSSYSGWGFQQQGEGRVAQGHNSAFVDDKGRAFVVYHTRFDGGGEWFQDRVHQLFLNRNGWLVCAPFEYNGETLVQDDLDKGCLYTEDQIVGRYSVLQHRYRLNHEQRETVTPVWMEFTEDNKVVCDGEAVGTWTMVAGTGYITVVINSERYDGVVTRQTVETSVAKALCISGLNASSGEPMWAYKMEPEYAVAFTAKDYTSEISDNDIINKNFELSTAYNQYGASILWTSSEPEVVELVPDGQMYWGHYNPADTVTPLTLTCRISAGNSYYEQAYSVKAARNTMTEAQREEALSSMVAYYDFEQTLSSTVNQIDPTQKMSFTKGNSGTRPELERGVTRESRHANFFAGSSAAEASYAVCPNPLKDKDLKDGFSISLWVRSDGSTSDWWLLPIWSITDKRANMSTLSQTLYFTPNVTVGFTAGDDYFYANKPVEDATSGTGYMDSFAWRFVTFTCDSSGIATFVNGVKKSVKKFESSAGTANTASKAAALFDFSKVLDMVASAQYMQLGLGVKGLGTPLFSADDLIVHEKALTASQAATLNRIATRVADFTSGINDVPFADTSVSGAVSDGFIRDLSGRRVAAKDIRSLPSGIYILNGKKIKR
ncbi:MAG: glycoside hydrolase family 43 protein [Bacteroidaceae bacterium]|nr:glycoside hydrolase family 43 protein [Bacteroidaceae bacterium]